jgi:hypothetical protein
MSKSVEILACTIGKSKKSTTNHVFNERFFAGFVEKGIKNAYIIVINP